MATTNENIRQLLDMLDNPDAYTEQEILDIINRNEDTRQTYRLMVEAKRSSRLHQTDRPIDVDAAWQRLHVSLSTPHFSFFKMAASFIGILFLSGIAIAAIHLWKPSPSPKEEANVYTQIQDTIVSLPADSIPEEAGDEGPVAFDNIPLEKMLSEIAAYYQAEVVFQNEEVRQLRFYFIWKHEETLEHVLQRLNRFESVNIELKDKRITVE